MENCCLNPQGYVVATNNGVAGFDKHHKFYVYLIYLTKHQ